VSAPIYLEGIKPPARVVVAMSGGVDSSVTAALMVEAGYEVIGMTMQLYDHGFVVEKTKACCAGIDIYDARQVAERLGIRHYVLDYESRFKEAVIDDFVESYTKGHTPIPCVQCNQTVKFVDMLTAAKNLGAAALVTGHYVRRLEGENGPELHRGADLRRDQSYFLFSTTKEQLSLLHFPVGGMDKDTTRRHAHRFGLEVADKPDSQDICFIPDGDYASLVEKLRPGTLEAGDIVHTNGQVLGQHSGTINYTVGQRRGLGVSSPDGAPLYVVEVDPQTHRVVVGPKEALSRSYVFVNALNWLGGEEDTEQEHALMVKIRSAQTPVSAKVSLNLQTRTATIALETPEYGIACGQACVFYDGDRVMGGGWIMGTAK
jgi:tRNA-specific 2-thiouridylase